ncbi:MAG: dipicolinate synthase subunit B [Oscillospiraceae bacterium]|nr:dipicolinate synthase subunit B [Oscillospiraceae bacterium]
MLFTNINIAYAITGSYCTFADTLTQMEGLAKQGANIIPIMSQNAYSTDTRFGKANEIRTKIEDICQRKIIHTIADAEPIGPKKMADIMLVAPCTGNTLAKLANSITDTAVTMAVKSHIRNARPVVLCIATNDALAGSAKNIGALLNNRNYFFVPLRQDDFMSKPVSIVSDFTKIPATLKAALIGKQLQPLLD